MVGLPNFYKDVLPTSLQEDKKVLKLFTGLSISVLEATLLCPVERVKVHFMTQVKGDQLTYAEFFRSIQGNAVKELFRGYTPLLIR